jgi:dTDP-4-amino-4,6-dideoxygalactose transaminase
VNCEGDDGGISREIGSRLSLSPLHQSPLVVSRWSKQPSLPVTEDIAPRLLRLPLYYEFAQEQIDYVADQIAAFFLDR